MSDGHPPPHRTDAASLVQVLVKGADGRRLPVHCPYCNSTGLSVLRDTRRQHTWYQIRCDHCGARGPIVENGTQSEEGGISGACAAFVEPFGIGSGFQVVEARSE